MPREAKLRPKAEKPAQGFLQPAMAAGREMRCKRGPRATAASRYRRCRQPVVARCQNEEGWTVLEDPAGPRLQPARVGTQACHAGKRERQRLDILTAPDPRRGASGGKGRGFAVGPHLATSIDMSVERQPGSAGKKFAKCNTVVVIGGSGGMSERYREVAEQHGCSLRHYEKSLPAGARRGLGKVALVVIMVTMVSHSLRDQARRLTQDDVAVVYLQSASISALRNVMEKVARTDG